MKEDALCQLPEESLPGDRGPPQYGGNTQFPEQELHLLIDNTSSLNILAPQVSGAHALSAPLHSV